MTRDDLTWIHRIGRDSNGEKFVNEALIHGSGRIMGWIICPTADEFAYWVMFYCKVPKAIESEGPRFIDLDSAKEFLIATVVASQNEPVIAKVE